MACYCHLQISIPSVNPLESSIDQAPYVHILQDGMITAVSEEASAEIGKPHQENVDQHKSQDTVQEERNTNSSLIQPPPGIAHYSSERDISDLVSPVKKCLNQLSRQNQKSVWLLAYVAIITTWPVVGPALSAFLRRKFRNIFSGASVRR